MNDNAKKWVAALRSGEYKQTKNVLRGLDGFCCLGVACDIYDKTQWKKGSRASVYDYTISDKDEEEKFDTELPKKIATWLGLMSCEGFYESVELNHCLTNDNDKGKTFEEIAAIIESEPEGLFIS